MTVNASLFRRDIEKMSEEQKNQNPETENASETTEKTETKSVNTSF